MEKLMTLKQVLLQEFDVETAHTRKSLERVPEDKFGWKPHEKSGTMGWLAQHLAQIPFWANETISKDDFDIAPPGAPPSHPPAIKSWKELLELFDKAAASARESIASTTDEHLSRPWTLLHGGKTVFTLPRIAVLRSFVFNHSVHHRAQLGVYLRLNNIPVPAIYGPSADEGAM
jgi:uncharacterized damage-inducible protein DinB